MTAADPPVVVFDVNETLSDLAPLVERFTAAGATADLAATWFASVLRDGFALAVTGEQRPFADIARQVADELLATAGVAGPRSEAVAAILAAFEGLTLHPDVVPGLRALHAAGHRLVTLSNGAAAIAEGLLSRNGVRGEVEQVLSVVDAAAWKPAAAAYRWAAARCGVPPQQLLLVAVHPWDVHGAAVAGLATAWIHRPAAGTAAPDGPGYPPYFRPPGLTASGIDDLAGQLATRRG